MKRLIHALDMRFNSMWCNLFYTPDKELR